MSRPSWDEYFMEMAYITTKRATCLKRHYGSCLVKDNKIKSNGYCGNPIGMENCTTIGVCKRADALPGTNYTHCASTHSELNSIIMCNPEDRIGATLYIACLDANDNTKQTSKPCRFCLSVILNSGG